MATIEKYRNLDYKIVLIFLGDIFHSGYDNVFDGILANNLMIKLRGAVDDVYSLIGNHELTYYTDNPFWTLMTKVDSQRANLALGDRRRPKGNLDIITIPDELICGNVRFIFNHFSCGVHRPDADGLINIGLFHQDIYTKAIVHDIEVTRGQVVFEHSPNYFDKAPVFKNYDYAFLGHAHLFYSEWNYICDFTGYKTNLTYLSTLGRTNQLEVQDNFLERDIPAIVLEDGRFVRREYNKFDLLSRSDCVIEKQVELYQQTYQERKAKLAAREYIRYKDDPIENLRISVQESNLQSHILDGTLINGMSPLERKILQESELIR